MTVSDPSDDLTTLIRESRRAALVASSALVGIDYVVCVAEPGATLARVHFVPNPALDERKIENIGASNLRIVGLLPGSRPVAIASVRPEGDHVLALVLRIDPAAANLPTLTLSLVGVPTDPFFSLVTFRIVPARDVSPLPAVPPAPLAGPVIDYMARDFVAMKQLILDRMSLVAAHWQERDEPDLGITIVEILAYVADYLSYHQDAVATEAYLWRARRRISVRRHLALLDTDLDEGVVAQVWVRISVDSPTQLPVRTPVVSLADLGPPRATAAIGQLAAASVVFETEEATSLIPEPLDGGIHTWGSPRFVLHEGTTTVTLRGAAYGALDVGAALSIEQALGPDGTAATADPRHAYLVRLSEKPVVTRDPLLGQAITVLRWRDEDALPCTLTVADVRRGASIVGMTIVRLNLVRATHGATKTALARDCLVQDGTLGLPELGLAWAARPEPASGAAEPREPEIEVHEKDPYLRVDGAPLQSAWTWKRNLLRSGPFDRHFTLEIDDATRAWIRFGDGVHGRRPADLDQLAIRYRVGGGPAGNIGRGVLTHVLGTYPAIVEVQHPRPATGGRAPETTTAARERASRAGSRQLRCVTEADYVTWALQHPEVRDAAAILEWNGSWYVTTVYVDRVGNVAADPAFCKSVLALLDPLRIAGVDLAVLPPRRVPLDIRLLITPSSRASLSTVMQGVLAALGRRFGRQESGASLRIGETVYLSDLVARAAAVPGVVDVQATRFTRMTSFADHDLSNGFLPMDPTEVALVRNDPLAPEEGALQVVLDPR